MGKVCTKDKCREMIGPPSTEWPVAGISSAEGSLVRDEPREEGGRVRKGGFLE